MAKYIKREDALTLLSCFSETDALGHTPLQIVEHLPTADAVEVVRCRECANWDDTLVHDDYHYCYMHDHYTGGDFYCANGERKECMTN